MNGSAAAEQTDRRHAVKLKQEAPADSERENEVVNVVGTPSASVKKQRKKKSRKAFSGRQELFLK